jgi:hypothetical protein
MVSQIGGGGVGAVSGLYGVTTKDTGTGLYDIATRETITGLYGITTRETVTGILVITTNDSVISTIRAVETLNPRDFGPGYNNSI